VRQLENAVKRFLIFPNLPQALAELEKSKTLVEVPPAAAVAAAVSGTVEEFPVPEVLSLKEASASAAEKAEKELIFRTLNEVNWNRKRAAQRLNICYKSLLNKLQRWNLEQQAAPREIAKERAYIISRSGT
jgi:two-component system response regulator AtoC